MVQPYDGSTSRLDALHNVLLQRAVDVGDGDLIKRAGSLIGGGVPHQSSDPAGVYPPLCTWVYPHYCICALGSTQSPVQWVADFLGSGVGAVPGFSDPVCIFFGAAALDAWKRGAAVIRAAAPGRQMVWAGHSLGGAAALLARQLQRDQDGTDSIAIVTGCPRPGSAAWASSYPAAGVIEIGFDGDPIPSVPPSPWASLGGYVGWIPFPPTIPVAHPTDGFTLLTGGNINTGYTLMGVPELVTAWDFSAYESAHNWYTYASSLRRQLPDPLADGYGGYAGAGSIDDLARDLFPGRYWPWGPSQGKLEVSGMGTQMVLGLSLNGTEQRAWDEVYYHTQDNVADTMSAWTTPVQSTGGSLSSLLAKRLKLLSKSCSLYYMRASHVGTPKQSVLDRTIRAGQAAIETDTPEVGVVYRISTPAQGVHREVHLRGIPDAWVADALLTGPGIAGVKGIDAGGGFLYDWLTLAGGAIHYRSSSVGGPSSYKINGASKADQFSQVVITLVGAPSLAVGTFVDLGGLPRQPQLRGRWQIAGSPATGQYALRGSERYGAPVGLTGWATVVINDFIPASQIQYTGVRTKHTGRKKYLPRGRSSAKLLRR
jgi:hypothetical protein